MKKILGLDLGTTSIGWAFVKESENENEQSEIVNIGVRVNPLTVDEQTDFEKGRPLASNADRTLKRGMRRNLDRYKQRRKNLLNILKRAGIIDETTILTESGKNSTYETLRLRATAARRRVEKNEFARVLFAINKKRGYKSSRKAKGEEDGQLIDGMGLAKKLYEENLTPGEFCLQLLQSGKKQLPDFYRSDLKREFDKIWDYQKQFYRDILTDNLYELLQGKNKSQSWAICKQPFNIVGIKRIEKGRELKIDNFRWRKKALSEKVDLEYLAIVLQEINNSLYDSSGYLGAISDRSKELYFNRETVGENQFNQIKNNKHTSLNNQVFYRQDYLDEFEQIWETQKQFHPELTEKLKREVRDVVIFYQRQLKSQKGLISFCEFESSQKEIIIDGQAKIKTIGARVCPKSSPLFQEFKIWQNLSNVIFKNKAGGNNEFVFNAEDKALLFEELNAKGTMKKDAVLKFLGLKKEEWDMNYSELQGNITNSILFDAYEKILEYEEYGVDFKKNSGKENIEELKAIFNEIGIDPKMLDFDPELEGDTFNKQLSYQLWHLLYSYEGDKSATGTDALKKKLQTNFGFKEEHTLYLVNVQFPDDYGNLSTKAIRRIFPYIKENTYSEACRLAGYNHSKSLTKEENLQRELNDKLELLEKNSLRNPVVEKILNQMVNVVNAVIDNPEMGKPDEVRIELARELKKNAKERAEMTSNINKAKAEHEGIKKKLQQEFGIRNPSRTDIIKFKLYKELEANGYKTLYTNRYISPSSLFSGDIDIEHIIPKSRLFDDSFSNKTLEFRQANLDKSELTAYDYVAQFFPNELDTYVAHVEKYFKDGHISKAKYQKLLKKGDEIGDGFIERDLRESQYIAKKAKDMLLDICRTVVSTSGSITDRLREDWGLIHTMKELNIEKYRALGLTEWEERKDGQRIEKIKDWTKRNDHRHHAMDALTIAFTKHSHIQYLNNLNARKNEKDTKHSRIIAIEQKETVKGENGKRLFKEPIPHFRQIAKAHLESVFISHKAKNKVVTQNKNKVKGTDNTQVVLTPRGQLHKETIYGKSQDYVTKEVKVGASFDIESANKVAKQSYKEALLKRLSDNGGNPKKAFGGNNAPSKNPILTKDGIVLPEKVKLVWLTDNFTIRKDITPDIKVEKVVDQGVKKILEIRLKEFGGNPKEAFANLDQNPIWLNKAKGIAIKRVTISGVNNAEALHLKRDHNGQIMYDEEGKGIPTDYVSTGNNHHVAIYRDEEGKLQEELVSFYEAVARVNAGVQVVNKEHPNKWKFLFTMKQNEMFVFPGEGFEPQEIDWENAINQVPISKHMFRVQKFTNKDYFFRHHLETDVEDRSELKGITWKREGLSGIEGIVKVRLNHLGKIVQVGEY